MQKSASFIEQTYVYMHAYIVTYGRSAVGRAYKLFCRGCFAPIKIKNTQDAGHVLQLRDRSSEEVVNRDTSFVL